MGAPHLRLSRDPVYPWLMANLHQLLCTVYISTHTHTSLYNNIHPPKLPTIPRKLSKEILLHHVQIRVDPPNHP